MRQKKGTREGAMLSFSQHPITCLAIASLAATLSSGRAGVGEARQIRSFDSDWRFYAGEINGAEKPEFNDSSWLKVDVPHDWSIEGLAHSETKVEDAPELHVVKGEWKFSKGDNMLWKDPEFNDGSWQTVKLPSTWEEHSNYTQDNVYGWYRRELTIPADLQGKDICH